MLQPDTDQPARARWLRTLLPPLATGLASLLVACGGGGGGSLQPTDSGSAGSGNPSTLAASRPGELLALIKATLQARQAQRISAPGFTLDAVGLVSDR